MNLIVAVEQNWGIGKDGTMPWHISADMKYFREKRRAKPCSWAVKRCSLFRAGGLCRTETTSCSRAIRHTS